MQFNFNMGRINQDILLCMQYCADHQQCDGCVIKDGQALHINNSVFVCEHYNQNKENNNETV